ncbi:MAG: hypothetical protein GEU91_06600 [Rhizobiales bacterium]|nr:hypothetical protein [Hyphomicrobiales bacterium]
MEEAARLRRAEAEGFRTLARIKLDAMVRDRVIADLDATERRALATIENHRQALEALARRRDEAQAALDKAEAAKHDRDQELANALDALDQQRQRTAERIETDSSWQAAKVAVAQAEEIAANADEKASRAEADLAEKGKPYDDDPLFTYLWTRRHGQAEDTSGNFVRFFDRRVAQLIGYRDARANYAMLQEIPARLREHAKSKQGDVDIAKERVAETERKALVTDGIEALDARVEAGHTAVKAAENAVMKITGELEQIEADRQKALGPGDDAVYGNAVELLSQALAQEDLRQLYQEALRTPTKADEQAIISISKMREELPKADGEVAQIRTQIRDMARRRTELEGGRDRARNIGYDDPRGTFGSGQDVLGQVIGGILSGTLGGGALDRVLRDNYRRPVPRADPDFGGWGRAPSWPYPWDQGRGGGGSWPGGGGASSGGSGGGWRTGGSF